MALSIIIPQYNHARMTEECIDSIINNTLVDNEIILVDNGSVEQISDTYKKKVKYIRSDNNLLFAGGCNLGAAQAQYPILCFLNNDILLTSGWDDCVAYLNENPDVGIVGPKLIYPNNTIQHAGVQVLGTRFEENTFDHRYRHAPPSYPPANEIRSYQCITGACIFIRKDDFNGVGGFDNGYLNGYEDNDLCFKVRMGLGKKVVYYPLSTVIHKESITSSKVPYSESPNKVLFFKKWGDKIKEDKSFWDKVDHGEVKANPKKLAIFYWCSGSETSGEPKSDKFRPPYYNKKKCFKSLVDAAQGTDIYVIYDGAENDYSNYLKSHPIKGFTKLNLGSGLQSIKEVYNKIYELIDSYDNFYMSEDDYLYLPDAIKVLKEGVEFINPDALFTLYDHPDRYTRSDDLTRDRESLAVTPSSHWRTAESTCSSFCVSRKVLQELKPIFNGEKCDRDLFRYLLSKGVRLWSPIHGRATHLNTKFLSPLIDWERVNDSITE